MRWIWRLPSAAGDTVAMAATASETSTGKRTDCHSGVDSRQRNRAGRNHSSQ